MPPTSVSVALTWRLSHWSITKRNQCAKSLRIDGDGGSAASGAQRIVTLSPYRSQSGICASATDNGRAASSYNAALLHACMPEMAASS